MNDEIDNELLEKLNKLVGLRLEFCFERRGRGDSNYEFHGSVLSIDPRAGVIAVKRTRSHKDKIHEIEISSILTVTYPSGNKIRHKSAVERDSNFRKKQDARIISVAAVKRNYSQTPLATARRSGFSGRQKVEYDGQSYGGYLFTDDATYSNKVNIIGKNSTVVCRFMAMQDIFVSLDDTLLFAIEAHIIWPLGVAYERISNPDAFKIPWLEIYKTLDGLPIQLLKKYVNAIKRPEHLMSGYRTFDFEEAKILESRNLLMFLDKAIPIENLVLALEPRKIKEILAKAGESTEGKKKDYLVARVLEIMTPRIEESVRNAVTRKMRVLTPLGVPAEDLKAAIEEQRTIMFLMRQVLYNTGTLGEHAEQFFSTHK